MFEICDSFPWHIIMNGCTVGVLCLLNNFSCYFWTYVHLTKLFFRWRGFFLCMYSALWPFSTLGWPDASAEDFRHFYPTTVLETGSVQPSFPLTIPFKNNDFDLGNTAVQMLKILKHKISFSCDDFPAVTWNIAFPSSLSRHQPFAFFLVGI